MKKTIKRLAVFLLAVLCAVLILAQAGAFRARQAAVGIERGRDFRAGRVAGGQAEDDGRRRAGRQAERAPQNGRERAEQQAGRQGPVGAAK